jgi:peptide/nickel transport system substrate-binding protein
MMETYLLLVKKSVKIGFMLALTAGLGLSLASCAKKDGAAGGGLSAKSLTLAIGGEPDEGFDPCTGWGRYGSPLFQSTLLEFDRNMNFANDLAAAYSVSDDGLTWTFDIRSDAAFSDGKPLSAEDVAFTFNTAKESGSEIDLTRLESARAESPTRVVFTLNRPMSAFLNIAVTLGIVPKHAYGPAYGEKPVGSGPYRFVQWDKGQQLIIERNEDYYGTKPVFERVTLLFLDTDGAFAAVRQGSVDLAMTEPALVRDMPGYSLLRAQSVDNRGVSLPATPSGTKNAAGLAVGNDVTSDQAIRKALVYGIDRAAIARDAISGYGTPAYSVCDGLPWWNPGERIADNDAAGQKAALESAGWSAGADGIRAKNGLRAAFTLIYPAGDSVRQAVALAFAQQSRALGIEVSPSGKSWDDIRLEMYRTPVLFGWGSHSPMEVYSLYYNKLAASGYDNVTNSQNAAASRYMDAALSARSAEEANENWKKAAWDGNTGFGNRGDATWCWIVNLEHLYFVRAGLDTGNQRIHPHGHGFPVISNIKEWRLK